MKGSMQVPSKETREKISRNNARFWLGKKRPDIKGKTGMKGYKHTPEAIQKIKAARARQNLNGSNSWFWKGGVTPKNLIVRMSGKYSDWRSKVFKRDNYTCQWCGRVGGKLNADHIKPFWKYKKLRFCVSNGRTLCVPCHKKTNTYGKRN